MYNRVITCNHIHISFILFRKMASADLPSYPDLDAEIHMLCPLKRPRILRNPSADTSYGGKDLWLTQPSLVADKKKTSPRS